MANKRYIMESALEEREDLLARINKGNPSARANLKARILLNVQRHCS